MRNKKILLLLFALLICYIVSQTILLVLTQDGSTETPAGGNQPLPDVQNDQRKKHERKNIVSGVLWNMRDFTDLSHQHGIPMILLDRDVLLSVVEAADNDNNECRFFCTESGITSYGVMNQLWKHDEDFLQDMEVRGFSILYFTDESSETAEFLTSPSMVYTNYYFHRSNHTIHLTVLYTKPSGYLWHGGSDLHSIHRDTAYSPWHQSFKRTFGKKAGAFEKMEVIKITLDGIKTRAPRYPASFLVDLETSQFLQCNYTRAKRFHSLYGKDEDEQSVISFREATQHVLTQAKSALDKLEIPFWLSSGTCLGWYRQCDSIHYSRDVDLGIWIKDYKTNLIPVMLQNELSVKHILGKESDSFTMSFENGEVKLDLFFFYEENDHMWNGATRARTGEKFKYIFPKFTLCWTEFLGLKLRVPCETEQYLEANYGEDWFKPVKTWSWSDSPPNAKPNGVWPEHEREQVLQMFE